MGCANSSTVVGTTLNETPYCITFLGLSGVGKTSIIEYFTGNYDESDPPIHTNGIVINDVNIKQIKYRLYDVSGFQSHTLEWQSCIEKSDCVVIVVDPTGIDAGMDFTRDSISRVSDDIVERKIPVFLILNKSTSDVSTEPVENMLSSLFSGVQYSYKSITKINEELNPVFDWIEKVVMHKHKL